ncbi:MAG: sporulation protein YunB [Bacillaceae bacterium]|nr:sporulation protein YunB [Bacillaceae bacterium]
MQKLRRRSRGPLPLKYVFLITFVFFNIFTVISLLVINKGIEPFLMSIAETKARQIAAQAINDAVSKKITDNINVNELFVKIDGQNAYIVNSQVVNRVLSETTLRVQRYLDLVESGDLQELESFKNDINIDYEQSKKQNGIVYSIPLGMSTGITLFSNLGPKIPVRFEILGDVVSQVETDIVERGINNTYLEVNVNVTVQMNVIIPLLQNQIEISNPVKIGDLLVMGDVPQFYHGGGGNGAGGFVPVMVPDEEKEENNE